MTNYTDNFKNFLFINSESLDWFVENIRDLVSYSLFDVEEDSLPSLLEAFYLRIGRRNSYSDEILKGVAKVSDDQLHIIYVVYECFPLITYIDKFLKDDKEELKKSLILYTLLRLRENSKFTYYFTENITPPHPYVKKLCENKFFLPNLQEFIKLHKKDKITLLMKIIVLTALLAARYKYDDQLPNDKKEEEEEDYTFNDNECYNNNDEDGPKTRRLWNGKANKDLELFNVSNPTQQSPLRYQRYPILESILVKENSNTLIKPGERLIRPYYIHDKFPDYWKDLVTSSMHILRWMKDIHSANYVTFINKSNIPKKHIDIDGKRHSDEWSQVMLEMSFSNLPYFQSKGNIYLKLEHSLAGYSMVIQRYISEFILYCVSTNDASKNHITEGTNLILIGKDIYVEFLFNCWFAPEQWSDKLVRKILSDNDTLKSFTTTCLIILALDLKMTYSEKGKYIGFYNTREHLAYVPNRLDDDDDKMYKNVFVAKDGRTNYYGMLLGDNRLSQSDIKNLGYDNSLSETYTPIRAAWVAASSRRYLMAVYCNKVLRAIRTNGEIIYQICKHQQNNCQLKNALKPKKEFFERIDGLYRASHELLSEMITP